MDEVNTLPSLKVCLHAHFPDRVTEGNIYINSIERIQYNQFARQIHCGGVSGILSLGWHSVMFNIQLMINNTRELTGIIWCSGVENGK